MSYNRGNLDLTYKNHKVLKIVENVIHYLSILWFSPGLVLVEKFSLKYFLKSRTFTENLFVNFLYLSFSLPFFLFSPLVTGSLRVGGGGG